MVQPWTIRERPWTMALSIRHTSMERSRLWFFRRMAVVISRPRVRAAPAMANTARPTSTKSRVLPWLYT